LLPSVGISLYFYAVPTENAHSEASNSTYQTDESTVIDTSKTDAINAKPKFAGVRAFRLLWLHFINSYSNFTIVLWSIWWALAMAGFLMVQIYVQLLWQEIDADREFLLNAGVEALLTLFGALFAFLAGFCTSKRFQKYDMWILTVCSLLEGTFIVVSSQTTSIWNAYVMYILFGVIYSFMITIATATVAKQLADDSFALIFGCNTFLALVVQSILTVVVITGLGLSTRNQFLVYGCYFIALAVIYLVTSIVQLIVRRRRHLYVVRE